MSDLINPYGSPTRGGGRHGERSVAQKSRTFRPIIVLLAVIALAMLIPTVHGIYLSWQRAKANVATTMPSLLLLAMMALTLLAPRALVAAEPTLEALVDDLQKVSEPGYGYTGGRNGSEFLPYPGSGNFGVIVFGGPGVTPSETLKKIVERGAEAIPVLIKHLDDARPIKMAPVKGMMWMSFDDEYDINRLNAKVRPEGVNRFTAYGQKDPREHALTVGDLCFVALGQIVNRSFTAARYQPTAGMMVNSPSYSKRLCAAVVKEWGKLTRDEHRQSLINDFVRPDRPYRRVCAYQRLTFYYPDTVEKLVLEELQVPTFESSVVRTFCEELRSAKDGDRQRKLFQEFVEKHGPVYLAAAQHELLDDLRSRERREERAREIQLDQEANGVRQLTDAEPPLELPLEGRGPVIGEVVLPETDEGPKKELAQLRTILINVFKYPEDRIGTDAPYCKYTSTYARKELIAALVHDQSRAIGDKVREIYLATDRQDHDLREACLLSLASRDYPQLMLEELARIDVISNRPDSQATTVLETLRTSRDPKVKAKLLEMLHATRHAKYFVAIHPAVGRDQTTEVLKSARVLLAKYADDDARGTEELLEMINAHYRADAKPIFQEFLRTKTPQRGAIMGSVLWHGDPWAVELLAPFLDERRNIPEFPFARRVCDHVAQAISHANRDLEFNTDWALEDRDQGIEKIKAFCEKHRATNPKQ